jgi:hypothetical protein
LITYYTVFVIDLASRRVQILGSTPHPETLFMQQIVRTLTMAHDCVVDTPKALICDRDRKWSGEVRRRLQQADIRLLLTPARAPNANHALIRGERGQIAEFDVVNAADWSAGRDNSAFRTIRV